MNQIELEAQQRVLILDGAMATMIQPLNLKERDFRNEVLYKHSVELKGNNDLLNLTRPDVIRDIHQQYLNAGADIISTNTFGANRISQEDYQVAHLVYDINYHGAKLAKKAAWEHKRKNPGSVVFVAGSIGPTTKLASLSPDVSNPGFRAVTFDQLAEAYTEQAIALIDGGVDLFLLETITDTLNAKAALYALMRLFDKCGRKYPIMVSGTITDASGRILSGQTIEAFIISISHAPILSIGLNCALGAKELRPHIETLSKECPFLVSVHPNAGLPNHFGSYDQSANEFAHLVSEFVSNGWLNIVGGCCGTTPGHISATAAAIKGMAPRVKPKSPFHSEPAITDYKTTKLANSWLTGAGTVYSLGDAINMISKIKDRITLKKTQDKFNTERKQYHPEQAMLLNAHLFGRYQYLRGGEKAK